MSESHGRFKVRKGEVEIEYEGVDFIQEYKAALAYFGITRGAQTRLGDSASETQPERAMKPQASSHPVEPPALWFSGVQRPEFASEVKKPESSFESPGPTLHQPENPASEGKEASASHGLVFDVLTRGSQRTERKTELQTPEPKDTKPSTEDRSPNGEGAYPTGMENDNKFKDVLKRLGLAI
jgi:hypothetical protein